MLCSFHIVLGPPPSQIRRSQSSTLLIILCLSHVVLGPPSSQLCMLSSNALPLKHPSRIIESFTLSSYQRPTMDIHLNIHLRHLLSSKTGVPFLPIHLSPIFGPARPPISQLKQKIKKRRLQHKRPTSAPRDKQAELAPIYMAPEVFPRKKKKKTSPQGTLTPTMGQKVRSKITKKGEKKFGTPGITGALQSRALRENGRLPFWAS